MVSQMLGEVMLSMSSCWLLGQRGLSNPAPAPEAPGFLDLTIGTKHCLLLCIILNASHLW